MKNEWLVVSERKSFQGKDVDVKARLSDIMSQIDEGRGWRFTDEQADTLAKLVDNLIEQVRAYNKKRNENRKRDRFIFLK
jgi:hypothetical protein